MKNILRLVGIVVLLFVFVATYFLTTGLTKQPQVEFTDQPQTIGQVGGFHYLYNWELINNPDWYRLAITTRLSRSSVLEDIETPHTNVSLYENILTLTLTDTQLPELSDDPEAGEFIGKRQLAVNQDPITTIQLVDAGTDRQRLRINLERPTQFRLQAAPNDSGVLWLDILK